MSTETYDILGHKLRALIKGEFGSFTIGFNDEHSCNYKNARDYADEYGQYEESDHWINADDRNLALDTNSVWSIQWYPDTPIGFYRMYASSLPKLLAAVFAEVGEGKK